MTELRIDGMWNVRESKESRMTLKSMNKWGEMRMPFMEIQKTSK